MKLMLINYILLGQINSKKKDMYSKAKRFGFTDSRVVTCSQELDTLLNKYQEMNDANFQGAAHEQHQFVSYN